MRNDGYTVQRFLNYLQYRGTTCPVGVSPGRWGGMLTWYATRLQLGEPFCTTQTGLLGPR